MLCARTTNTFVLPEGALSITNEVGRAEMSTMKGLGLNLAALPRETLYQLQVGVTELHAREGHALQVMSEQKINMEQLSLQCDELVAQTRGLEQAVEEACSSIPELVVLVELPTTERIHRLAARVREARDDTMKVQLELNLHIVELRLKAQPSTPLEVRE